MTSCFDQFGCPETNSGQFSRNPTLEACLRSNGPRVLWINLEMLMAILICFYLGSHHLARAANLHYEHYALMWMEFQRHHAQQGSKKVTEDDFYPVLAKFLHDHLEEEVMEEVRMQFINS